MVNPKAAVGAAPINVEAKAVPKAEIERLWRDLEARATPSFFLSWSWIGALLDVEEYAPELMIARLHDRVVGLGLISSHRQSRFGLSWPSLSLNETGVEKYDCIMIEDNGFLAEAASQEAVTAAGLKYLLNAPLEWRELRLSGVPESVVRIARDLSMPIAQDREVPSPVIELAGTADDNLARLSSNTRQQVRRSIRLYQERGNVTVTPSRDLTEVRARFAEMEKLNRLRWLGRGTASAFAEPHFGFFHRNLITGAFPRGEADVLRTSVGGDTLGLLYVFFYRGEAYVYQNGFRYESDGRLKPGLVSHVLALDYCKGLGIKRYRLLAGDSRYKRSLATKSYSLHWLSIRRPHVAFRVESIARLIAGRHP
jgi:CelD/BcsL family acetyltransferase involved in cellulose biosynthesis